jgi:lysophospholipase L1-like esterase
MNSNNLNKITFAFNKEGNARKDVFHLHQSTSVMLRYINNRLYAYKKQSNSLSIYVFKGDLHFSVDKSIKIQKFSHGKKALVSRLFNKVKKIFSKKCFCEFSFNLGNVRITKIRRLQKVFSDVLESNPDAIILGLGLNDWIYDEKYNQSNTSCEEFKNRLENIVDILWELYRVYVVFLFPEEPYDEENKNAWGSYIKILEAIDLEFNTFKLIRVKLDGKAESGKEIDDEVKYFLKNIQNYNYEPKKSYSYLTKIRPEIPVSTSVITSEGKQFDFNEEGFPAALWLSSNYAAVKEEEGGIDEGSVVVDKKMNFIGGRDFFERWMQLRILLDLESVCQKKKPLVAIIGDSIRMRISDSSGYGLAAYELLKDKVNIIHNPHNCGNSKVSLNALENWLSYKPKLIFINHGLHDCAVKPDTFEPFASYIDPDEYKKNIRWIAETVKKNEGNLLWGYCTPVDETLHSVVPNKGTARKLIRRNSDIQFYNSIAKSVMDEYGFKIVDIFTPFFNYGVKKLVLSDGVHLNDNGSAFVGSIVAEAIMREL